MYNACTYSACILYSQKYNVLNLAVEPQIAIATVFVDLNLVVWYRIAIRVHMCMYMRVRNIGGF